MGDFLTPEEFAEAVGISPYTARKWLREGVIQGKKFGRFWRISKDELSKILPVEKDKLE